MSGAYLALSAILLVLFAAGTYLAIVVVLEKRVEKHEKQQRNVRAENGEIEAEIERIVDHCIELVGGWVHP